MQRRKWRHRIQDILNAIDRINSHVRGLDREAFFASELVVDAVQRNFMVIGEAATHIPDEVTDVHPQVPWRQMRDMRNILIHIYWGVSPEIVWNTIQQDLPLLPPLLLRMLDETSE